MSSRLACVRVYVCNFQCARRNTLRCFTILEHERREERRNGATTNVLSPRQRPSAPTMTTTTTTTTTTMQLQLQLQLQV